MDDAKALLDVLRALRLRKAQALLFYLAAEYPAVQRTEKIVDLFWQDKDRALASTSFRQVVRQIRVALAPHPGLELETANGATALKMPPGFSLQGALTGALASARSDRTLAELIRVALGQTELLLGISASFDSWLAITRARLLSALRRALDRQMTAPGHPDEALWAAEFALDLEPSHEAAVRFLMTRDWQQNRATRAIERYNTLYAHLDAVYDQEPEPETIALLAAIKLDPAGPAQPAPIRSPVQVSLQVQMLANPSLAPEAAALAEVLHADLRLRLGRFREWRVIDPASDTPPRARILLRALPAETGLRLFVEVLEGAKGDLLWSESVDQPDRDWEAKVRIVLVGIANALSVVLAGHSLLQGEAAIYDRWLRSQVLLDTWSPDNEGAAIALLSDITREAPRFGAAHAELAGALNVRHVLLPGTHQSEEIRQSALHHAIEAVSIDPLDTRAHRVLAWCYCHKSEFSLAEFHFEQALSLNPSNPLTLASCALGFAFTDSLDRAAHLAGETRRHSATMEPFHLIYLAATDYLCGDFAGAERQCARGAGLMTTVGGWHSAALWKLGRRAEAAQRLADWQAEIAGQWRGQGPASREAILDWFTAIFPLRNESAREDLRRTLSQITAQV